MLKLKLQYFGHLMQRTDLLEKTGMLRKPEGKEKDSGSRDPPRVHVLKNVSECEGQTDKGGAVHHEPEVGEGPDPAVGPRGV